MSHDAEGRGFEAICRWFAAALIAVDPYEAIVSHLGKDNGGLVVDGSPVPVAGSVFVAAVGKAAAPMAEAAHVVLGPLVSGGAVLTKDGHLDDRVPVGFRAFECAHPVPELRNVDATRCLLDELGQLGDGDVVLALISGGGSAILEAPLPGVTLEDIAATTNALLRAGAPIHDLNAVRVPLSATKGGGLRRHAPRSRFVTLILSDVMGNDTQVIASGPTVATTFTAGGALATLERYGLLDRVPPGVIEALRRETEIHDDSVFARDVVSIVGDNEIAVQAAFDAAQSDGLDGEVLWSQVQGEARELAVAWVDALEGAGDDRDFLLGGGEASVTVSGDGRGGRNTEFALAAAIELERRGLHDWMIASLATDGQDALTGVAGAIASTETLQRARAEGVDPVGALVRNDSLAVFDAAGGAVQTGPTGTNVNDIYIAFRAWSFAG